MGTVLYVLFGLWLLFIGTKLVSAAVGLLFGFVRSRRAGQPEQKGTNP